MVIGITLVTQLHAQSGTDPLSTMALISSITQLSSHHVTLLLDKSIQSHKQRRFAAYKTQSATDAGRYRLVVFPAWVQLRYAGQTLKSPSQPGLFMVLGRAELFVEQDSYYQRYRKQSKFLRGV